MKKYNQQDKRYLATFAAGCAERVLPFFEEAYPKDERPRTAIEICRTWIRTGVFKMSDIRAASLAAHAAAREAKENKAACFAARAAGQAVATAHVTQHALGAFYYALKAIAVTHHTNTEAKIIHEISRLVRHLPKCLKQEILNKIIVKKDDQGIIIKIKKGKDF